MEERIKGQDIQDNKRSNKRKRKLLLLLFALIFTGIMVSTSTYAWFTANQTVTLGEIMVNVEAQNGIQLSADGTNWKSIVQTDDLKSVHATTYTTSVNQIPDTLEPVSTVGNIDADGKMEMYYGVVGSNDDGDYILTATKDTEVEGTTGKFIAIDLFSREKSVHIYKTEKHINGYQIVPISSFDESIEAIDELGIKASDLLQANGIIWVEGPSDRIYIKNWIDKLYPDRFEEGKDYQFVYYGGRLLAHYTACDPTDKEIDNYINVLAVNTKAFFVMDSDKRGIRARLEKRKKHIIEKLEERHISYWITKGREIENYLDLSNENIKLGQFDKLGDKLKNYDKINFAKQHYANVDFNKYNLKKNLNELAAEIARWNNKELSTDKR